MAPRRRTATAPYFSAAAPALFPTDSMLILGDNVETLPIWVGTETVDLIYLDPPFNSNANYNMLFRHVDGTPAAAQIRAFDDTWGWNSAARDSYEAALAAGGDVGRVMNAFWEMLNGPCNMLAYLSMMAPRLVELRRVLKPTGSIYLHCDDTASSYLRVLMDAVFGPERFLNAVTWKRTTAHNDPRRFGRVQDRILYYSKTSEKTFNRVGGTLSDAQRLRYRYSDERGPYKAENLTAPHFSPTRTIEWRGVHPGRDRQWRFGVGELDRLYAEGRILLRRDGRPRKDGLKEYLSDAPTPALQDLWTDIQLGPTDGERIGYPTQKPLALLERIIEASSNPGDLVLDPFCGCGTAVDAAQRLGRRWIGIDVSRCATDVIEERLHNQHPDLSWTLRVFPPTIEEAERLAETDRHAFQEWVCYRIGAAPGGRGADRGIDGTIDGFVGGQRWRALVSVKSGTHVNVSELRDLHGTVERERAQAGIFVTLKRPPGTFGQEVVEAGVGELRIPRLQVLTIADLFAGRRPAVPAPHGVAQFDASETDMVNPERSDLAAPSA